MRGADLRSDPSWRTRGDAAACSAERGPGPIARPLGEWPASLHPDLAERTYPAQRQRSRLWVDGLVTRSGVPRWARIKRCGAPVVLARPDGAVSWEHAWCRDRACYACARSRSRKLGESLRTAVETRDPARLHFVTLTRPRQLGESPEQAWRSWQQCWAKLRHCAAWRAVVGGVRTLEATYSDGHQRASRRFSGWHVHAHCVIELIGSEPTPCPSCEGTARARGGQRQCTCCGSRTMRADGTMPLALSLLLRAWVEIVAGSIRAQCGVRLDAQNVGQLAKYLTKLWELPPDRARDLFRAAAGKRIVEGFGAWRKWKRWGAVESTPHGWLPCGVPLRQIEAMPRDQLVEFYAKLPGVELSPMRDEARSRRGDARHRRSLASATAPVPWVRERRLEAAAVDQRTRAATGAPAPTTWRPTVPVVAMTAGAIVDALRRDQRPVWRRLAEEPPDAGPGRGALVAQALRELARREYRGHVANAPPERTWEY